MLPYRSLLRLGRSPVGGDGQNDEGEPGEHLWRAARRHGGVKLAVSSCGETDSSGTLPDELESSPPDLTERGKHLEGIA